MRDIIHITKALAEKNRLRILLALRDQELCGCQIAELVDLAPSTVSKHLSMLTDAGLVDNWKDGRWVYFKLAPADSSAQIGDILSWVQQNLAGTQEIEDDARRLKEILKIDKEELCHKHRAQG